MTSGSGPPVPVLMAHSPFQRVLSGFRQRQTAESLGRLGPIPRARSLCVVSGKGGTGKSVITASLARVFAHSKRTLLVDADLGVGNAHILQGHTPKSSLADLFSGRSPESLVEPVGPQLDLLAGGSGVARLASASHSDLARIGDALATLERAYGYLLADCGAGISEATLAIARSADRVIVVTTPDLTAMTDAYAFLKLLGIPRSGPAPMLLVNRAASAEVAADTAERVQKVAYRFLGRAPEWIGWIPNDADVMASVNARKPFIEFAPQAPATTALLEIAVVIREALEAVHPGGLGRHLAADPRAVRA